MKLGESILDYSKHQNYKGNRFIRMSIKIALLADLCGKNAEALYREFAEIVFLRTLHYLNSQIQPDAVVLTGSAEKYDFEILFLSEGKNGYTVPRERRWDNRGS